jgi:CheY-like chemotaxis protein
VADTGKGIAKDDIDRILQPFVQVADKNHRDGTGLGLAICCRLAKLMGGELTVSSEVGVGSTFTVALRGVKAVGAPTRRQEPARLRLAGGSLRVLVVDDSSVNRIAMRAMLAKCGVVDVLMAENGRRALEMLRGDERGFDLVLTDLWMPEMDGNGLVREVRSDTVLASLPVYLVTADVEARHQAESDGFSGVLLKPVSLEDLQSIFA